MIPWLEQRLARWAIYARGDEWYGPGDTPIGRMMEGEMSGAGPGPRIPQCRGVIDHAEAVETAKAIIELDELQQRLIWYRYAYYRPLSVAEISARCGISRASYYRAMPAALVRLSKTLESTIYRTCRVV